MLQELWDTLRPQDPKPEKITKKWIDIGFQGQDPSTDFRGTGLKGLEMLYEIAVTNQRYTDLSQKMYAHSTCSETWFFFAVTGINITKRLFGSLKYERDQVVTVQLEDEILKWLSFKKINVEVQFTQQLFDSLMTFLYANIFENFTEEWVR